MSQTRYLNTCISLIFLRRTKTAYVSIVDDQLLGIAQSVGKNYPPVRALDSHGRVEAWTSIWAIAARFTLCIYGSHEGLNQRLWTCSAAECRGRCLLAIVSLLHWIIERRSQQPWKSSSKRLSTK